MDKSFHPISVDAYTKMIDLFRSTCITLEYCVLTTATLSALKCACDKREIKLNLIDIFNSTVPLEAFAELASVIGVTKCSEVTLLSVDLNANKLSRFRLRCIEDKVEVGKINIYDSAMQPAGYNEFAMVTYVTKCKNIFFGDCDLDKEKLLGFRQMCQKEKLLLDTLQLRDKNMNGEGYSELASVLEVTRCQELTFHQCDLNDEKLCQFWKQCKLLNVRVGEINIWDSAMQPAGYNEFAMVINVTKCKNIFFGNCDLDKEKLLGFRQMCQKEKLLLDTLHLRDKNMNGEGYSELASVLEVTGCRKLVLDECDLNDEKLCQFWKQCKSLNVRLNELVIHHDLMTADCYRILPSVLNATECQKLTLSECDLNESKLRLLCEGCRMENVQIQELDIRQQGYVVTDEVITQICELMEYVVTHISISGWVMNEQHKTRLKSTLDLPSSKAKILNLSDE